MLDLESSPDNDMTNALPFCSMRSSIHLRKLMKRSTLTPYGRTGMQVCLRMAHEESTPNGAPSSVSWQLFTTITKAFLYVHQACLS